MIGLLHTSFKKRKQNGKLRCFFCWFCLFMNGKMKEWIENSILFYYDWTQTLSSDDVIYHWRTHSLFASKKCISSLCVYIDYLIIILGLFLGPSFLWLICAVGIFFLAPKNEWLNEVNNRFGMLKWSIFQINN